MIPKRMSNFTVFIIYCDNHLSKRELVALSIIFLLYPCLVSLPVFLCVLFGAIKTKIEFKGTQYAIHEHTSL